MTDIVRCALLAAAFCIASTVALADPCEAIPENGPMPDYLGYGARFSGEVVHVIDGDSLCVAVGGGPSSWVEVRLSDFYAPELASPGGASAKAALERIALGQAATCTANMRTYDRIAARCTIGGAPLGDRMRAAGVREGGAGSGVAAPVATRSLAPVASSGGAFGNCAAARAAGAAPLRRGEAGYGSHLDRDGDGIACEPYRGR